MSVAIVLEQMIVIFCLIGIGFFIYKKEIISQYAYADLSKLITEICNPAMLICSAFGETSSITNQNLLYAGVTAIVYYVFLIFISIFIPWLIKVDKKEFVQYHLMGVYGNISFMGIPLIAVVLGDIAVVYLAIFILVFNLLLYTHGIAVIRSGSDEGEKKVQWRKMNTGTVAAILTLILFVVKLPVPQVVETGLVYMGRCTTFLSMVVMGVVLARMKLKDVFTDKKLYIFAGLRYLLVPSIGTSFLKAFIRDEILLGVIAITLALPAANIPLMLIKQHKSDGSLLAKGIVLTTILSLFTVTIVSVLLFGK